MGASCTGRVRGAVNLLAFRVQGQDLHATVEGTGWTCTNSAVVRRSRARDVSLASALHWMGSTSCTTRQVQTSRVVSTVQIPKAKTTCWFELNFEPGIASLPEV